jgi:hypothetical protein
MLENSYCQNNQYWWVHLTRPDSRDLIEESSIPVFRLGEGKSVIEVQQRMEVLPRLCLVCLMRDFQIVLQMDWALIDRDGVHCVFRCGWCQSSRRLCYVVVEDLAVFQNRFPLSLRLR